MDKAYSLIEVIIILSLISITLLMSEPYFTSLFRNKNTEIVVHRLINLLQVARSEAITRNKNINICPSRDGVHCSDQWSEGQIVIEKDSKLVLARYPPIPTGSLFWRNSFGRNTQLTFNPLGFTDLKGSFLYLDQEQNAVRIVIEKSGRWRVIGSNF